MHFDGLDPSTTVKDIKLLVQAQISVSAYFQRLSLLDNVLDDLKTLDQCGVTGKTIFELTTNLRKPMIYIIRPQGGSWYDGNFFYTNGIFQGIEVQLSLDRTWELSILHPSMKISPGDYVQSINWTIDLRSNKTLFDRNLGREVMYLFWDGQ
jgi:hypothetical protein